MDNIVNITDLIEYLKFGYEGNTIDLIYLFLLLRFFIGPLIYIIYNKIKGVIKNDR